MNVQVCRLCLQENTTDDTILVDIFGSFANEEGKPNFSDKINWISGLKINKNDGLPSLVCHKCLVIMDNFIEFRGQIQANDEKLRKFFNLANGSIDEDDEEEAEIVKLDPNKMYESSDEESGDKTEACLSLKSEEMMTISMEQKQPARSVAHKTKALQKPLISNNQPDLKRKEIFHCKFCDIVFSDSTSCNNHENFAHDPQNPFECLICKLKFITQPSLIIHIKNEHKTEKPYLCVQCPKTFIRRSDLRKHVFVHAGIRLFNCNICSKSFTRSTNLAKHKRSHEEILPKNYRCMLCPKAFHNNDLLSRHMEMHMNRSTFNCKYCNLVFSQRDELEVHQKSHAAPQLPSMLPMHQVSTNLLQPMGFYNQIQIEQPPPQQPTFQDQNHLVNFYHQQNPQANSLRTEYPIMNQLLSNYNPYKCDRCNESFSTIQHLQNHQSLYHAKNFSCSLCSLSYFKKKELDRHILSTHTDIKYNCSKCSKSFSRKDKLLRHEKIHLIPQFFNCALCAAVFIKKHLLDLHMKIHEMPNANSMMSINQLNLMTHPPPPNSEINLLKTIMQRRELPPLKPIIIEEQPATLYPINLSINHQSTIENEPINLSNVKSIETSVTFTKIEPPKIIIDSDDDDDLRIIENNHESIKPNGNSFMQYFPKTESLPIMNDSLIAGFLPSVRGDDKGDFQMSSRMMEKLEPSKDLPMEILQSPN